MHARSYHSACQCRSFSTAVANWLEEKGGLPLFTIEGESQLRAADILRVPCNQQDKPVTGEEPEDAKHSWDLPSISSTQKAAAQGAADVAEQLSEAQDTEKSLLGDFSASSRQASTFQNDTLAELSMEKSFRRCLKRAAILGVWSAERVYLGSFTYSSPTPAEKVIQCKEDVDLILHNEYYWIDSL